MFLYFVYMIRGTSIDALQRSLSSDGSDKDTGQQRAAVDRRSVELLDSSVSPTSDKVGPCLVDSSAGSRSVSPSSDTIQFMRPALYEHIKKTVLTLTMTFSFVYLMTVIMVVIDNRSLEYFYGVNDMEEWSSFSQAVRMVNLASNDEVQ